uniref:Uncharacterized protein n=1 Tax=Oryza punctata TaxID=4537 RepID=A0A0E0KI83_ORYPU
MVRCTHASLCFFALTSTLLVLRSGGAMPSREVMRGRPSSSAAAASPVGSSPTEELVDSGIAAGREADAAARPLPPTPAAVGDRGGDGEPRSVTAQVLRHSARRLLVVAGEDTATDGAAASCRSNNVHITCTPPSPR